FYVAGSHGRPRYHCERENPSSYVVARIPVNAATGRPDFDDKKGADQPSWVAPQIEVSRHVRAVMLKSAELAPYVDACLQTEEGDHPNRHGVNIEGMAILGSTLYLGFRGPVLGGSAFLLAVDRDGLFKPQPPEGTTIPV